MKLGRYKIGSYVGIGIVEGETIIDLKSTLAAHMRDFPRFPAEGFHSLTAFIEAEEDSMPLAQRALELYRQGSAITHSHTSLKLLAPLEPRLILCSGENYWDHRDEKPVVEGREPEFFMKAPLGVIGEGDPILLDDRVTSKLDYECELVAVIGKPGRHISRAAAPEHIFGYTIMNDVTARDRQVRMRPDGTCAYALGPGKNFDTCAPLGPVIVTRDEIQDPQALALHTLVNEEVRQSNSTTRMIWSIAELVEFFSVFLTLRPGVIISTGTPGGTGWGNDVELGGRRKETDGVATGSYLRAGDIVACEIEKIGVLRNPVVAAR